MSFRSWLIAGCLLVALDRAAAQQPIRPISPGNANPEFNGKSLDQWIKEVEDRDPSVRESAIKAVGAMGPQAKRAVPALIRQLQSPNDLSPQTNAAIAIGMIVPDDPKHLKDAIGNLTAMLSSSQGIVRFQAATALGNLGPPAKTAIPRLASLIRDPASWEIRKAAAFALGRAGYEDKTTPDMKALNALIDGVDDLSKEVRIEALQGIINLGPPPSEQDRLQFKIQLEKRIKQDKDKYVAIWVRVALMRLDATAVNDSNLTYIANQLKSSDPPGIGADSARALGAIGPLAGKKVGELVEALQSKDVSLVTWAAWALGRMGQEAKGAVPALTVLLESSDPGIKASAQEAIKSINNPPKLR